MFDPPCACSDKPAGPSKPAPPAGALHAAAREAWAKAEAAARVPALVPGNGPNRDAAHASPGQSVLSQVPSSEAAHVQGLNSSANEREVRRPMC